MTANPGRLAANVVHFARVLRASGMPVGTDRVAVALKALQVAGLATRLDLHAVLTACLLDRADHRDLFNQAFDRFWRVPDLQRGMDVSLLDGADPRPGTLMVTPENLRLAEAFSPQPQELALQESVDGQERTGMDLSWNDVDALRQADFASMSSGEWRQAQRLMEQWPTVLQRMIVRRWQSAGRPGRIDARATLHAMARQGGELAAPRWRRHRQEAPPLVVLADISGSMSRYSRMLLHLTHAVAQAQSRVECFVFATRLTRITRQLRQRDPDVAVAQSVLAVPDWSGGTRIHECLRDFNRRWARRVMPGTSTVLLVTDGLERDDPAALGDEMARLRRGCRRVLWLNPLLRFDGFQPLAGGIRAMLPHVDRMLAGHNLASLSELMQVLAGAHQATSSPRTRRARVLA